MPRPTTCAAAAWLVGVMGAGAQEVPRRVTAAVTASARVVAPITLEFVGAAQDHEATLRVRVPSPHVLVSYRTPRESPDFEGDGPSEEAQPGGQVLTLRVALIL
jgi:hypothetical protein